MGNLTSTKSDYSIKKKLRNIPYSRPTERDFDILASDSNLSRDEVVQIIEEHLEAHPDGRMNRKEFCELYKRLRRDAEQLVNYLTGNIFQALGVSEAEDVGDLITLREFLMIYSITTRGDPVKKLEYAFDQFDINDNKALEVDEAREIINIILELLKPPKETQSIPDITKECMKHMKVIQVIKKG